MPLTLQDALLHHQAGELSRAAEIYRQILTANPRHADAYHLLGVLMHQLQHSQVGADLIGHAIRINDRFAPYHNNLGNTLLALGRREDARTSFRRSIGLSRNADAYINLATLDLGDGHIREAESGFKAALRLSPNSVAGLLGLGRIAMMEGQTIPATKWVERTLSIEPDCIAALNLRGDIYLREERLSEAESSYSRAAKRLPSDVGAHLNLGHLYIRLERYQAAAESYGKAVKVSPDNHSIAILLGMAHLMNEDVEAAKEISMRTLQLDERHAASHQLLGNALVMGRDYEKALASFKRSLSLEPERHEVMNGIGNAYEGLGDYHRASQMFAAALALQPQNPVYLQNVGLNLARQGDSGAIAILEQAIAHAPNDPKLHVRLAESLLSFGDYRRGFAEYEWRWRSPSFSKQHRQYDAPLWDGSSLSGRTILLHAEQGFGDTIQFVRFLPQVACLGGAIILVVQAPLVGLFESLECIRVCLPQGEDPLPAFDVQCPLLSLPAVLKTEPQTIPEPIDLGAVVSMGQPRQRGPVIRVGLVWAGNPTHQRDSLRSLPLASLLPLRGVPGCTFFSLQRNLSEVDRASLSSFAMEQPLEVCRNFLDTAHVLEELDLIISVDTAMAHLAATLHKRVWLILPEAADWRWGTTGDTTPWYPAMRLFRRRAGEITTDLVERLVTALNENTSEGAS